MQVRGTALWPGSFRAQSTHLYNSQTTPSHLFDVLKQTTIPIAIDDISEKAQDTWEELIIDAYNNTPRGTRSYSCEIFCTLPVISANWRYSSSRSRAFTRVIQIPFVEHSDEPNASTLYSALSNDRSNASASVGKIIDICSGFSTPSVQTSLNDDIFPKVSALFSSSHVRFKTTYTVFMHLFLKVSHWFAYVAMQNLSTIYSLHSLLHAYTACRVVWRSNYR